MLNEFYNGDKKMKHKLVALLITSVFMISCGVSISSETVREGNYATYEIYKLDTSLSFSTDHGEIVDYGCISLDSDSASITSIFTDDPYDDKLTFEYTLVGGELEYGFTVNDYDREMRTTSKYTFIDDYGSREVTKEMNGEVFVAVVSGNTCLY